MGTSSPEVEVTMQRKTGEKWCAVFFFWVAFKKGRRCWSLWFGGGALLTCFLEVVVILFGMMCFFFVWVYFVALFGALNQIFLHSERKNEKDCQTDPGQL